MIRWTGQMSYNLTRDGKVAFLGIGNTSQQVDGPL
jgi:hypothetical protein